MRLHTSFSRLFKASLWADFDLLAFTVNFKCRVLAYDFKLLGVSFTSPARLWLNWPMILSLIYLVVNSIGCGFFVHSWLRFYCWIEFCVNKRRWCLFQFIRFFTRCCKAKLTCLTSQFYAKILDDLIIFGIIFDRINFRWSNQKIDIVYFQSKFTHFSAPFIFRDTLSLFLSQNKPQRKRNFVEFPDYEKVHTSWDGRNLLGLIVQLANWLAFRVRCLYIRTIIVKTRKSRVIRHFTARDKNNRILTHIKGKNAPREINTQRSTFFRVCTFYSPLRYRADDDFGVSRKSRKLL